MLRGRQGAAGPMHSCTASHVLTYGMCGGCICTTHANPAAPIPMLGHARGPALALCRPGVSDAAGSAGGGWPHAFVHGLPCVDIWHVWWLHLHHPCQPCST